MWGTLSQPRFPCAGRYLTEEGGVVLLGQEVDVSGGDDAHQLAAHGARLSDGDAREAMPNLGLQHITDSV